MRYAGFILGALAVSAALAVFLSPFASSKPDGLERVARDRGFAERTAETPAWGHALAPDYAAPGIPRQGLSTAVTGLAGTLGTFAVAWAVTTLLLRRRRNPAHREEPQ